MQTETQTNCNSVTLAEFIANLKASKPNLSEKTLRRRAARRNAYLCADMLANQPNSKDLLKYALKLHLKRLNIRSRLVSRAVSTLTLTPKAKSILEQSGANMAAFDGLLLPSNSSMVKSSFFVVVSGSRHIQDKLVKRVK